MPRPIVHIGYPKTASTWFQKEFYPHVAGRTYVERDRIRQALLSPNALPFDAGVPRDALVADAPGGIVICEEGLSGYLHNGGIMEAVTRTFADRLKAALPDADIVIVLRAQPAIIASTYQQYVRAGGTHSAKRHLFPHAFLIRNHREQYKVPLQDVAHFDYLPIVRYYRQLFGEDRVHLFLFEDFARDRDGFLRGFSERLGVSADPSGTAERPWLESVAYPLLVAARLLNLFTYRAVIDKRWLLHIPGCYALQGRLLDRLNRTGRFGRAPTPERLLGRDVVRWIEHRFAGPNRELAELTGLPLAEHGWVLDAPEAPFPVPDSAWRRWYAR
mgnify:CR=1 FL=1